MTELQKKRINKFQPVIIPQEELSSFSLPIYVTTRKSLELFHTKSADTVVTNPAEQTEE